MKWLIIAVTCILIPLNASAQYVVGSFETTYNSKGNASGRAKNIAQAMHKLNGYVVFPGETFSFNQLVGPRTKSAGYHKAKTIENGRLVDGIGGGVCQVSSTLYAAALLAGLEILQAKPHSIGSKYTLPGMDAMVSDVQDLKFKNSLETPVTILASNPVEGVLRVELNSTKPSPFVVDVQYLTLTKSKKPVYISYLNVAKKDTVRQRINWRTFKITRIINVLDSRTSLLESVTNTYKFLNK